MAQPRPVFTALLALLLAALACNLPSNQTPTALPGEVMTIAAQTIEAQLTQNSLQTPLTPTLPPGSNTPEAPLATSAPTGTATITPTCDLAEFVTDVTIPDGTPFLAGQTFTKTWRFRNAGVCPWNTSYQLIFESGESMNGPANQPLAGTVAPGQTVDISVNLKAPATPGSYRGYWKLRNPAGVLIPILQGHNGISFFVDIKVIPPTETPVPTSTPTLGLIIINPIFFKTHTPTPTLGLIIINPLFPKP